MTRHTLREPANQLLCDPPDNLRLGKLQNAPCSGSAMSSSTSSASKTATYCSIGGTGPLTYYGQINTIRSYHSEHFTGSASRSKIPSKPATIYDDRSSSSASVSQAVYCNRPATMVSIGNMSVEKRPRSANSNLSAEGIVYPCGGYCRTFERCFHYFLQFFFVIGILAGISLVLAAFRLHHQRPAGDQLVLVYIGVLITLVCALLLSIQCSVEREVERKKRKRRIAILLTKNNRNRIHVPLRAIDPDQNVYTEMAVVTPATAFCQIPLIDKNYHYTTQHNASLEGDMDRSQNGIPWWRRHEDRGFVRTENVVQL